ncbi:hypothetical protein TBLA_0H03410 [Henningerozyma blattae CBS 6284]|uniref:F-box domain-containing protein n=1 Tax=Henningerozyma blattae (strain ATCC 34711 / CBS 6284 / DSM 70876 / NBRC 10599 / NRRL Y-10934 / UCD 77-7) TaxID=1071380 RepID=I2H8C0_HENB6|nr:hypothetical protein TBLA_0H03410 [Tetrapisispora blattae CBS 6284]CCH62622.1 hypothetical protein TBLA_0H03410 [Tetrapisispora blattae CBS 6284]
MLTTFTISNNKRKLQYNNNYNSNKKLKLSKLNTHSHSPSQTITPPRTPTTSHQIFNQPELLNIILSNLDSNSLFNCLKVSKLWYHSTIPFIETQNLTFKSFKQLETFNNNNLTKLVNYSPKSLMLQNIHQSSIIPQNISLKNLIHLSYHNCSKILPPIDWFVSENLQSLKSLTISNNQLLDDNYLLSISPFLKNLKYLDLRACYNISDIGITSIATNCPNLIFINLNRKKHFIATKKNHIISSISLMAIANYTNIKILGISGSSICDAGMFQLIKNRGKHLITLSINDCTLLTNHSLKIFSNNFKLLPILTRLEICRIEKNFGNFNLKSLQNWRLKNHLNLLQIKFTNHHHLKSHHHFL